MSRDTFASSKQNYENSHFTLVFTFAFTFTLIAQITISGKVLGRNNKPLKDVSVTLKDTYDGATTDETGNYKFETSEKEAKP